jgi:divalent metal cation (Fe/Co/Zn/Cd) transporter
VSAVSFGWTALTSTTTVALGALSGSAVLMAFGAVGAFDAAGSAVLVAHFRHALRHEAVSASRERIAEIMISCGLLVVGAATVAMSAVRLAAHSHARESAAGIAIAAASIAVLGYLARSKRRLGTAIPSRALVADGWLSLAGAVIAVCTVAGTALVAAFGWWWLDPAAAACVAVGAIAIGLTNLSRAR